QRARLITRYRTLGRLYRGHLRLGLRSDDPRADRDRLRQASQRWLTQTPSGVTRAAGWRSIAALPARGVLVSPPWEAGRPTRCWRRARASGMCVKEDRRSRRMPRDGPRSPRGDNCSAASGALAAYARDTRVDT